MRLRRVAFVSRREGDGAGQLYVLPLDGGETERATDMPLTVSNPKWLPDGKRIAFVSSVIAGGEVRNLTAGNPGDDEDPVFSPDGRRLAYGRQKKADGWPDRTRLALLDLATGASTVLTEGFDYSGADWSWTPDGNSVLLHAEVRGRTNLYSVPAAGGAPREVFRGGTTAAAKATPPGEIVFQHHSASAPPEIALVRMDGSGFRKLTRVNDDLMAGVALGTLEDVTFKGAGGADVQMFVSRREPLDPEGSELEALVRRGPGLAGALVEVRRGQYADLPRFGHSHCSGGRANAVVG